MADATLTLDDVLAQQRALVDAQLADAALTVPVESDLTAMTAPPLISQLPLDFHIPLLALDSSGQENFA